jgi:hypothetical protein
VHDCIQQLRSQRASLSRSLSDSVAIAEAATAAASDGLPQSTSGASATTMVQAEHSSAAGAVPTEATPPGHPRQTRPPPGDRGVPHAPAAAAAVAEAAATAGAGGGPHAPRQRRDPLGSSSSSMTCGAAGGPAADHGACKVEADEICEALETNTNAELAMLVVCWVVLPSVFAPAQWSRVSVWLDCPSDSVPSAWLPMDPHGAPRSAALLPLAAALLRFALRHSAPVCLRHSPALLTPSAPSSGPQTHHAGSSSSAAAGPGRRTRPSAANCLRTHSL